MNEIEHVLAVNCELGEGPVWNAAEQKLYWVDILQNQIHTFHPESGKHDSFTFDVNVCAMAFREGEGLLVATRKHLAFWDGKSEALEYITEVEADQPDNRFNDGAVDRQGRFWMGTMRSDHPICHLYRIDPDLSVHEMETGITISNGIGWSPDDKTMYYTDSPVQVIYAYDFDAETGQISNRRELVNVPGEGVFPDGLTVDSEGYIWSARWDGANVTRHAPDGTVDRVVKLPTDRITSCTFGGDDLRDLYITSARTGLSDDKLERQPLAGDLFRLRVDVPGLPEPLFAG